jgi:peptide/nickel transport system substrate-binding protein
VFAALALVASACGGAANGVRASTGEQLTIGIKFAPDTLDPAKSDPAFGWYFNLAYDPLIYWAADGSLQPRLAESWGYVGHDNTAFELRLRPRVKFSDGSPLTAEVVKGSIEYYRDTPGRAAAHLAAITSVEVVDPRTVRLRLSAPNPALPQILTQVNQAGDVLSGRALAQPEVLAEETFGAGPYLLDPGATVANAHYTYVANTRYWNQDSVRYKKVVIKVLPNPNTALAALKTGQVDVIQGEMATADAATAARLNVYASAGSVFSGLALADRTGRVAKPLGDLRVRQALNYAVDREKITKGLYREWGRQTEQIVPPEQGGLTSETHYPYDPDRAKKLLAEAGYADGFTLPVLTTTEAEGMGLVIADDLAKVGVRLEFTNDPDPTSYLRDMASGKYPAYVIGFGTAPVHLTGPSLFLPSAAQFNPFRSTDPQLDALYAQAAAADERSRPELDERIVQRLVELAWFVPVSFQPTFVYARNTVIGIDLTTERPGPNPTEWAPA